MYYHWRSSEESVGIPLTGLGKPHFVPVPNQDLDFQRRMSWSFLCLLSSVKMRGDC
jgi:hypothetical protein